MSPRKKLVIAALDLSTERDVQRQVIALFRRCGCAVYPTSLNRATPAPGLPDLYVVHRKGGDWFFEVKGPGGKQRPVQRAFQETVEAADHSVYGATEYVIGGLDEARAQLVKRGVIAEQPKGAA